jgi:hypothetical protein
VRSDLWARSSAADDRAVSSREWTTRAGTRCSPNLASTPVPLRCSTSRGTIPSRGLCVTFRPLRLPVRGERKRRVDAESGAVAIVPHGLSR